MTSFWSPKPTTSTVQTLTPPSIAAIAPPFVDASQLTIPNQLLPATVTIRQPSLSSPLLVFLIPRCGIGSRRWKLLSAARSLETTPTYCTPLPVVNTPHPSGACKPLIPRRFREKRRKEKEMKKEKKIVIIHAM